MIGEKEMKNMINVEELIQALRDKQTLEKEWHAGEGGMKLSTSFYRLRKDIDMTFEECVEKFPVDRTMVGHYGKVGSFAPKEIDLEACLIDDWYFRLHFSFIIYDGFTNKFNWYFFDSDLIEGYINPSMNPEGFQPVIYTEGWKEINLSDKNLLVVRRDEEMYKMLEDIKGRKLNEYERWREQIVYLLDKEKYEAGYVFTTTKEAENFLKENFLQ